jgi:hypothetical protein
MTINYYCKDVYGQTLYYIENDYHAQLWRSLTGRKTITRQDISALTTLTGVVFKQILDPATQHANGKQSIRRVR